AAANDAGGFPVNKATQCESQRGVSCSVVLGFIVRTHGQMSFVDGERAVLESDVVVAHLASAVRKGSGDVIGADVGGGGVAVALISDGQVFVVDAGVDGACQVIGQVGRAAVGLAVIADLVTEGIGRNLAGAAST